MSARRTICSAALAFLPIWLTASDAVTATAKAEPAILVQTSEAELEFWRSVEATKDPAELEAYLKAYPDGRFAPLAKIRLKKLKAAAGPQKAPQQPAAQSSLSKENRTEIPPAPRAKKHAWLGVRFKNVDEKRAGKLGLRTAAGAEIASFLSFGPAKTSGLKPHDIVVSAGSIAVVDFSQMIRLLGQRQPGEAIELVVLRDGSRLTVKVKLGDFFNDLWATAHGGDASAMYMLGMAFAQGDRVEKDPRAANEWFRRAADAGNATAMNALGYRYSAGLGFQQDDREAVRWFRKAANAGNADGMFSLALHMAQGRGVARDRAEAARWYKAAGDKGHIGGYYSYAVALVRGDGVAKNQCLAVDYFRRAAKINQAQAFSALGQVYYTGMCVKKDMRQAANWFRRAADRNDKRGFFGLATMYERGEGGLPKDRAGAIKYFRKGAERGDSLSIERLKKLDASLYDPREVQQLLSDLGFDPGPVNGKLRRKTAQAIRAFQKSRGLSVDGEASLRLVGQLRATLRQKQAAARLHKSAGRTPPASKPDLGALKDLEKLDMSR